MTVKQLRADYEEERNDVDYYRSPANMRLIAAMPKILAVLDAAVRWADANFDDWAVSDLNNAVVYYTRGADSSDSASPSD